MKAKHARRGRHDINPIVPFVPGYRQSPFASSLLKPQRAMPTSLLVCIRTRYVVQSTGRRVQEHGAGHTLRRSHRFDLEPVETGSRLWYREILILRAFVREERRARLQGLHGPPRLRYVVNWFRIIRPRARLDGGVTGATDYSNSSYMYILGDCYVLSFLVKM